MSQRSHWRCWARRLRAGVICSSLRSRCIRSWPPLSWGQPGRERTRRMPRETSQADKHRQPTASSGGTEGRAVVALHRQRKAIQAKESLENAPDMYRSCTRDQGHGEDLAAEGVTHCQRLALVPVAGAPPPLEVDGPEVIGRLHLDTRPPLDRPDAHWTAPPLDLAEAAQDARNGAPARRIRAELPSQHLGNLLRPEARVALLELKDADHDLLARRQRARDRPPALLHQAHVAVARGSGGSTCGPSVGRFRTPGTARRRSLPDAVAFSTNSSFWLMARWSFQGTPLIEMCQRCPDTVFVSDVLVPHPGGARPAPARGRSRVDPASGCHGACAGWGKPHPQRSRRWPSSHSRPALELIRTLGRASRHPRPARHGPRQAVAARSGLGLTEPQRGKSAQRQGPHPPLADGRGQRRRGRRQPARRGAFGYLQAGAIARALALCDSVLATLWSSDESDAAEDALAYPTTTGPRPLRRRRPATPGKPHRHQLRHPRLLHRHPVQRVHASPWSACCG